MSWQKMPLDAEAGMYKTAEIVYHVDAGRLTLPVSVTRVEREQVSFDDMVSRPEAGCAGGRIAIRYPHPDGRTDFAEVRLVIERDPRKPFVFWKPNSWRLRGPQSAAEEPSREEWRLDLAKSELDELINQMRQDGCFTHDQPHAKAAELTIGFDGHRRTKPWSQSAPLESCMQRVRREGQLVALARPATVAASMTSSLDSYRALVSQGGGGDLANERAVAISGLIMPKAGARPSAPAIPPVGANGPMIADATPPASAPAAYPPPYNPPLNPPGNSPYNSPYNQPFTPPANAEVARLPGSPR
jgi:hypothetical protein